jgi:hypothetical protein
MTWCLLGYFNKQKTNILSQNVVRTSWYWPYFPVHVLYFIALKQYSGRRANFCSGNSTYVIQTVDPKFCIVLDMRNKNIQSIDGNIWRKRLLFVWMCRRKAYVEMCLRGVWGCGLDSTGRVQGPSVGWFEYKTESSGSLQGGEILDMPRSYSYSERCLLHEVVMLENKPYSVGSVNLEFGHQSQTGNVYSYDPPGV